MLKLSGVSKSFGDRFLFSDISLFVGTRDRIGVIGPNGTGKTTLFEIICGNIIPDSGSVSVGKGVEIGYMKQDVYMASDRHLLAELLSAATHVNNLSHKIGVVQQELAASSDEQSTASLLRELGDMQSEFESRGGYHAEHEAKLILSGLGFNDSDFLRPVSEFSGGWRSRIELAKLLFLNPDVLILDEPTNHLDLESIAWFESYLKRFRGALLVASHDRAFLNNVVTRTLAFETEGVSLFNGNYDDYAIAREERLRLEEATAKRQDVLIRKEMRFIERFRYKSSKAAQVQSRIKGLNKIDRVVVPRSTRKMSISLPQPAQSGKTVIALSDIAKTYASTVVYQGVNLTVARGDKVALVGPNGAGKTTLIKIIAGVLSFEHGTRSLGHNVTHSYFAQHYIDSLSPLNRIIDELSMAAPGDTEQDLRSLLGAFLFSGEDVYKPISVLSGGEKTRVALAKMLARPANLLLLDEPTNHLDIPSREILTDALCSYKGTMCFITHDRTLIREVATKILEIDSGRVQLFSGTYDDYLEAKEKARLQLEEARVKSQFSPHETPLSASVRPQERRALAGNLRNEYNKQISPLRDRISALEEEISICGRRLDEIEAEIADPETYKNGMKAVEITREHDKVKNRIEALTSEWETLSIESERLTGEFRRQSSSLQPGPAHEVDLR
jgi:ATP-binding cassette, subfamily F, member 3